MTRLLPLIVLALAGSAWASVKSFKSWSLIDDDSAISKVTVTQTDDGVNLTAYRTNRFEPVKLTKEEAASLGRALLEAAGESCGCPNGCIVMGHGCSPMPGNPESLICPSEAKP